MAVEITNFWGFILGEIAIFVGIAIAAISLIYLISGVVKGKTIRELWLFALLTLIGVVTWFGGYLTAKSSLKYVPVESPKGAGVLSVMKLLAEKLFFAPIGDRIAMMIGVIGFTLGISALAFAIGNIIYLYLVRHEIPSEWVQLLTDWAFLFSAGALVGLGFQIIHYVYSGYPVEFSSVLLQTPYAPLFVASLILIVPLIAYVSYKLYTVLA